MNKDTFKINNKALWIGGGILLLAGIGAGVVLYMKKKKTKELKAKYGQAGSSSGSGFCKYGDSYPLKHGSCGNNVTALQKKLKALGASLGSSGTNKDGVDGKYGDKTQSAVKKHLGKLTASLTDIQQLNKG